MFWGFLKTSLQNFGMLDLNLMVKRERYERKSYHFDTWIKFNSNSENCLKWSITNAVLGMWHSQWSSKSCYFGIYITLGNYWWKLHFFLYLCSYIHPHSESKDLYSCWCLSELLLSNEYFLRPPKHENNCFMELAFCLGLFGA